MKRFVFAAKFLIVIIALFIIVGCSWYKYEISPVNKDASEIEFVVNEGDSWYSISNSLKENGLIRSSKFYKFYIKLFGPSNLEAGKYYLSASMDIEGIVDTLERGSDKNALLVTFKEGINMRAVAKIISDNTNNSYDSVFELLNDNNYIDELITNYWFLTDDIKDTSIYYSLEGYLFPDSYVINKNSTVKEIFKLMLDKMDLELSKYKDDLNNSKYTVHQLITLSSIVELEAGTSNDRALVAGVFYNRLKQGITLGSDVTGYYAYKMDDWSNGLTSEQINGCNAYNTRGTCVKGLPVGPICNPGIESIIATLEPKATDNLFFVADCDGNTYLTKTNAEHEAKVKELKSQNKWCDS